MATTPTTLTIQSGVSDSPLVFGQTVSAAVNALGLIAIQDCTYRTVLQTNGQRVMTVTLLYWPGGGQQINATVIEADEPGNVDTAVNGFFATNPLLYPLYVFDVGSEDPRSSLADAVLILYSTSPSVFQPVIVRNLTGVGIATGATGTLTVLGSAGPKTRTLTGQNMSDFTWGANKEGYCAFDAASGQWLCVPHCC